VEEAVLLCPEGGVEVPLGGVEGVRSGVHALGGGELATVREGALALKSHALENRSKLIPQSTRKFHTKINR
jgi:hypothetical protein